MLTRRLGLTVHGLSHRRKFVMKKLTPSFAALVVLSTFVYAGPEPLPSGKEMKEVAPAPAPTCFNWSGFYVGGFCGYKRSNVDLDLTLSGSWSGAAPGRGFGGAAGYGGLGYNGRAAA